MTRVRRPPTAAPDDERPRGKLLDAAEVAERCGVSLRTVRRWIAAGDLVEHRLGRLVRVAEADLERFLEAHRLPGGAQRPVAKGRATTGRTPRPR